MTETELRKAIELVKKSHPYATKYKGVKEDEALQTLVTFAEQVLNAKEPKEILPETRIATPLCEVSFNKGRIVGYNSALHDFHLWQEKCLLELEEVIKFTCVNKLKIDITSYGTEPLAQAIRNLFEGKE